MKFKALSAICVFAIVVDEWAIFTIFLKTLLWADEQGWSTPQVLVGYGLFFLSSIFGTVLITEMIARTDIYKIFKWYASGAALGYFVLAIFPHYASWVVSSVLVGFFRVRGAASVFLFRLCSQFITAPNVDGPEIDDFPGEEKSEQEKKDIRKMIIFQEVTVISKQANTIKACTTVAAVCSSVLLLEAYKKVETVSKMYMFFAIEFAAIFVFFILIWRSVGKTKEYRDFNKRTIVMETDETYFTLETSDSEQEDDDEEEDEGEEKDDEDDILDSEIAKELKGDGRELQEVEIIDDREELYRDMMSVLSEGDPVVSEAKRKAEVTRALQSPRFFEEKKIKDLTKQIVDFAATDAILTEYTKERQEEMKLRIDTEETDPVAKFKRISNTYMMKEAEERLGIRDALVMIRSKLKVDPKIKSMLNKHMIASMYIGFVQGFLSSSVLTYSIYGNKVLTDMSFSSLMIVHGATYLMNTLIQLLGGPVYSSSNMGVKYKQLSLFYLFFSLFTLFLVVWPNSFDSFLLVLITVVSVLATDFRSSDSLVGLCRIAHERQINIFPFIYGYLAIEDIGSNLAVITTVLFVRAYKHTPFLLMSPVAMSAFIVFNRYYMCAQKDYFPQTRKR